MDPPTFSSINVSSLINNPPPTEAEAPPVKRKRLTQACDACRKKKVKCSGEKPTCNNCARLGAACTYLPSTRKRGPRVGLVESLEKRLQQMEKLLQPLKEQGLVDDNDLDDKSASSYSPKKPRLSNDDPPTFSRFGVDTAQNNSTNYNRSAFTPTNAPTNIQRIIEQDTPQKVEQITNCSSNSGKDEDQLIYFGRTSLIRPGFRHTSELPCSNNRIAICAPESPTISERSTQSGNTTPINNSLIPRIMADYLPMEIKEHLASCFFRYIDVQLSMFHEATFMRQLRQNKVSTFLVYAMCAVSSRYANHPSIARNPNNPPYAAGEHFATQASKMIIHSFDYPTVECVQAFILLTIHMFGTCQGPRAWMYIGMAIRMAQEIGLHKIDEAPLRGQTVKIKSEADFIQKETKRRTFWACFLLDRYTASAVGRPTFIDEDDCDVRLPCNEAIWNYDHPISKSLIEDYLNDDHVKKEPRITLTNNGLCASFISIATLLGRVTQFINRSKPPNSLPPWDPQSQFSILANELDTWYNSLSPHYTYSKERLQKLMANGTGIIFSTLHLLYNATVIVLNRPNIAILQNSGVGELNVEFMRASAERCSKAAKIVVSISSDILQNGSECFSPYSVYPIFVSTTILLNDTYSSNIAVAEEAKKNLAIVEQYLKTMSPYWAMGNKFLFIISEMAKYRAEQYEKREEKSSNIFNNNSNSESINEMSMGTDAGLLAYWNRTNNAATVETNNFGDISSIILPEEFASPRWLGNVNDQHVQNESWSNMLRSPLSFTPRTLRNLKKDKNGGENSTENDYFSHDTVAFGSYPPPVFDGYPIDLQYFQQFDWPSEKDFILNNRGRHWSSINMNEDSTNDSTSISTTTTSSTTPNGN